MTNPTDSTARRTIEHYTPSDRPSVPRPSGPNTPEQYAMFRKQIALARIKNGGEK